MNIETLDQITSHLTTFGDFNEFLGVDSPSLPLRNRESWILAEAYNQAQEDPMKDCREGIWPSIRPPKKWFWLWAIQQTNGTVSEIASFSGKSIWMVRKALRKLQDTGLVKRNGVLRTGKRGRPPQIWEMTFKGTLRISQWSQ